MNWWATAVGYEIYLRSFADSDGDGVGDLPGVLGRLDHLAWLGVDLVWITPFYPSPQRDHGYDVADYTDVDERFGTMADLDAVVERAHTLGLRVLVDLVPNHSSSDHSWFRQARRSRDSRYRDYYVWRDPRPDGGPPNNWVSVFGGPAWTLDEASGQYWLHLFLPEQPDLNWANPEVAAEFDRILRFWLERGVDGFRIDVAHALAKHPDLPDNPLGTPSQDYGHSGTSAATWEAFEHVHDQDQPDVLDVYRRWRAVVEPFGGLLLGEVYLFEADRLARYVAGDGLDLVFWFPPLHLDWDVDRLRRDLRAAAEIAPGAIAWVTSSHDRPRAASRFGAGHTGALRALALATLQFGLPGVPFLYQGEELGLSDGIVAATEAVDPVARRAGEPGRDGARTPMPWAPRAGLGFTTAERAWLPFGGRAASQTVEAQRADETSTLARYRALIRSRHAVFGGGESAAEGGTGAAEGRESAAETEVQWLTEDGPVIAYRRGDTVVAANCADEPVAFPLEGHWRMRFSSLAASEGNVVAGAVELDAHEARIMTFVSDRSSPSVSRG